MKQYTNLIPQNIATELAKRIVVFDNDGNKVGSIPLGNLSPFIMGEKLYSFGALSDIHMTYETAQTDFQTALTFFNETEKAEFICICGDLTSQGINSQMALYKECVDTYSTNTPVYPIAGNHESYALDWSQNGETVVKNLMKTYTGRPLYYSFTQGDDVFIMVGIKGGGEGSLFGANELQWLYETLELNRNKRCFVFQHVRPQDGCGNAFGIYKTDIWGGTEATVFENLMSHYVNAHLFHGHSHLKLNLQTKDNLANIDRLFGGWSIHIPSLVAPRTGNLDGTGRTELYAESEGYVVDVYEDYIVLRGRDFVKNEDIPLGTYCLDTTLVYIPAGTFTDSTGTITV